MAKIKRFEDSKAWIRSRTLFNKICTLTKSNEFSKNYKFKYQIENATGSIMDNIAEGFERGGNKELIQFLIIAKGSAGELRSQLYRAVDKQYISKEQFNNLRNEAYSISGMLQNWIDYLKLSDMKGRNRK